MNTITKLRVETGNGDSGDEALRVPPPFEFEVKQSTVMAPVLPSTMLLGSLRDPRLRLIIPLTLTFERENHDIVAYCEELDEFGFGTHLTEAIEDLQATIAELYFTFKEEHDRLGSNLQRKWDSLRQTVKEVS